MSEKRLETQDSNHALPENETDTPEYTSEQRPGDESDASAPAEEPADEVETAEKQAREYYDRLLRVSADFDNYRKRSVREMQELSKYANEELIKDLLSVVDNLERAIAVAEQESHPDDPLLKGVTLTLAEIQKILEKQSVKAVDAFGKPFDPNFHQAMLQEESDDHPPNTVVREFQKGYLIHDRLLRPALVAVSKTSRAQADSNET